jgi:eukaryotic-like serine/threonine-protein kinase
MAHEQGAAGSGDQEPGAPGSGVPEMSDSPEMWGNNGLVGDGRYRLTHLLGRGGMAEVFAAEDVRLGRPVAVKLLRADLAEDPTSKARFTREAQSVAGLNHHAVVAVYDSGEDLMRLGTSGRGSMVPFIVMELVHGRTIRELLLNSDAPPAEQALIIVSGVLEALAYSHHHGIVHRDIKPANVIITDTGTVKVMDFGIARALHGASQTMTQTGMVMGTPQYLSPEQALGKTVDTRSDLYAIGCLLYELLALRPPFVGETPLSVVYQHVQDVPRLPSEVSASAPPELDGLVMRALAKNPEDRFQTAEEMRGVAQYALRMLEEHGAHTGGLWNTGPVSPDVSGRPGGAGAPTARTPAGAPATATTSQFAAPMLLGNPGGDDGMGGGGHGGHRGRSSGNGRRRGRVVLVALAAVVAIGSGVLVAANLGGNDQGGEGTTTTEDTRNTSEDETSGQGSEETDGDVPPTTDEFDEETTEDTDDDTFVPSEDPTTEEETELEPTTPTESSTDEVEPTTPEETEPTTPTESEPEPTTPTESPTPTEPTPTPTPTEPTPTEPTSTEGGTLP